jgi:transposase
MENNNIDGAHASEQVGTGFDGFGQWLTVQEAVAYCLSKGLSRTSKTVRKWAQRARDPDSGTAEIAVKAQDTENGFRWLIERSSLDVKIEQEKQFEKRRDGKSDDVDLSAPVASGAHALAPVPVDEQLVSDMDTTPHPSAPVPTGANQNNEQMIDFLMKQIDTKDQQLAVKDRQIESMLERDHETNILIQGLQTSLTGVVRALPGARVMGQDHLRHHDLGHGDNSETPQPRDAIQ